MTANDRRFPPVLARTWHGNSQCLPRQFKAGCLFAQLQLTGRVGRRSCDGLFLMGKCVSRLRNCIIVASQKHTASLETCELLSNVLALAIRLPILIFSSFPDTFIGVLRLILPMRTTGAHQYPRDLASSQDDLPPALAAPRPHKMAQRRAPRSRSLESARRLGPNHLTTPSWGSPSGSLLLDGRWQGWQCRRTTEVLGTDAPPSARKSGVRT